MLAALTFVLAVGAVAAIVVLFSRLTALESQLGRLREYVGRMERWGEDIYSWVQAEARRAAVAEPEPAAPAEPEPAPEVAAPEAPAEPELVVPAPPPKPKVPVKPEPPAITPEELVPPAKPRVPVTPEAVAPRRKERVPGPFAVPRARPAVRRPRADVEVLIGTGWLPKIGMVAALLAMVFLLKWAWDQQMITPSMLVCLGILAGIALMVGGEITHRRGYGVQSQVLTGGGAAMLYLTLFAGLRLYELDWLTPTVVSFGSLVAVTVAAAVQAIRHESETVASFAWIAGYAVPALIGRGGGGSGQVGPLFAYLLLLSVGVFVVAQRQAWPFFTGLALMCSYASGAYIFDLSRGALGWTLTYLMLVTAGMLWVAATRKGRAGERFGAVGAVAGYVVTAMAMLAGGVGSPVVPYVYLLGLSGVTLFLGQMQGWRSLRWFGAVGSFVGFVMLFVLLPRAGVAQLGHLLLLYPALSVAGAFAVSAGRHPDAEPLATTSLVAAYGSAAILAWASRQAELSGAVSDGAMFAYLGALAAAVLLLSGRFAWPTFSRLGLAAAFLATFLLYEPVPGGGLTSYPFMYLVMLGAACLYVTAHLDDRVLGGLTVAGIFLALPLTGLMGRMAAQPQVAPLIVGPYAAPELIVPVYLAGAAIATLAVMEGQRWYGLEWIAFPATWVLYLAWRAAGGHAAADVSNLGFTSVYLLVFLAAGWVRHGLREARAQEHDGLLAGVNVAAYAALAYHDLSGAMAVHRGSLALGLFALYLLAGVAGIRRRPAETWFAPVLLGISIVFLTVAIPLLAEGYHITALWALEAAVLLGLGFYHRSRGLRVGGLLVLILPLFRAIAVDYGIGDETYQLLVNSRALAMLAVIAATYVGAYLYIRLRERVSRDEHWLGPALCGAATALLLWIASAEAWTYVGRTLGQGLPEQHFALSGVWLIFGAVLLALGTRRDVGSLRWSGLGLLGATVVKVLAADLRLTMADYRPLVNSHTAPLLVIVGLLYATAAWYARRKPTDELLGSAGGSLVVLATALFLWVASAEAWMYFGWRATPELRAQLQNLALSVVWLLFGVTMISLGLARREVALRWTGLVPLAATGVKVLFVDRSLLSAETYQLIANAHAFPLLVIAAMLYVVSNWYARNRRHLGEGEAGLASAMPVLASVLLWWVLTTEAWYFVEWSLALRFPGWSIAKARDVQQYALSAVWTLYGGVLIGIGLRYGNAAVRWTAMTLLVVTIAKVFLLDMRALDIVYRILALFGLAAVLILVGFGYQRLVGERGAHPGPGH